MSRERIDDLSALAEWEEELARVHGGHHAALARMIRLAISRGAEKPPRQQLDLFPGSTRPRVRG
jgi:hypothetical protein